MRRADALKKLEKILGKTFGYKVDPKAPDEDERQEAQAKMPAASARRKELSEQMEARRAVLLAADPEYQRLKTDYQEARDICENLLAISSHYRVTVGTVGALFFSVKAQGDSWEEVIAKLKKPSAA